MNATGTKLQSFTRREQAIRSNTCFAETIDASRRQYPRLLCTRRVLALLVALVLVCAGCGTEAAPPETETVTVEAPAAKTSAPPRREAKPSPLAKSGAGGPAAESGFIQCDSHISAKQATTTCGFAQNVFWEYWTNGETTDLTVYSPVSGSTFDTSCTSGGDEVVCKADDGSEVRFAQAAVDRYSQEQADAYATDHDLGPDRDEPEDPADGGGSDDYGGPSNDDLDELYADPDPDAAPPSGENIPNYENGNGYRVQCADGMYSRSGGIQGACSGHGGVVP